MTIGGFNIYDMCDYSIKDMLTFFKTLTLDAAAQEIGHGLLQEIIARLTFYMMLVFLILP